jgi:nitroimidazol reductase NimA-like FMN-containing flavoprotein (pyridoxamine 5'-phosphate oxidase superfamily)
MLRTLTTGVPACVTVTHLDGLVMARSGFNQSMNYRSVMALGTARRVSEAAEKTKVLKAFTERVARGRWDEIRPPTPHELKATSVLWMDLDEVSAKVRSGPPHDDEADYAMRVWAGVVPISVSLGAPEPDPRLVPGVPLSPAVARLRSRGMSQLR